MAMKENIRALIVDDESLARHHVRGMLGAYPEIEVIGECANGRDAIRAIQEQSPDLVFLDVEMRRINGFDVLKAPGVGLFTSYGAQWLGDKRFDPVFEELNRHGTTVLIATHDNDMVNQFRHPCLQLVGGTFGFDSPAKSRAA